MFFECEKCDIFFWKHGVPGVSLLVFSSACYVCINGTVLTSKMIKNHRDPTQHTLHIERRMHRRRHVELPRWTLIAPIDTFAATKDLSIRVPQLNLAIIKFTLQLCGATAIENILLRAFSPTLIFLLPYFCNQHKASRWQWISVVSCIKIFKGYKNRQKI